MDADNNYDTKADNNNTTKGGTMDKDTRKVLKEAEDQGFTVTRTSDNHPMIRMDGRFVATASSTPGDVRALRNLIAALRRHGFVWPPAR
jgi:peptidoglycan/xylan/chitin deacetylase (PgdA/CDA1 family)